MFTRANHNFRYSFFENLEERVLFDGVPDGALIIPETAQHQAIPAQTISLEQGQNSSQSQIELIVIDDGIENGQALLSSLIASKPDTSFEVYFLDSTEDGIKQITDLLSASDRDFKAIHVLTHGNAGNVELGSSTLNLSNINRYQDDLGSWSDSLTADADIIFYGCDLAGNENGQELLEIVSLTTGADVAAYTDLTVTLTNNGYPEVVTVLGTPSRVGQMLERVFTFNETADVGRATFVFDVSGIAGFNATIASEFGLIISDQPDLADGPGTTTLVASGGRHKYSD